MKRMIAGFALSVTLLGGIGLLPAGIAQAWSAPERVPSQILSDVTITGKVKAALMEDKQVSAHEINVDTVKGVVQLKGNVDSKAEAQRAVALARKVEGVSGVKSFLKVVPNETTASGAERTAGQTLSDATITGKVKTALMADKHVPARTINVDTVKGTVQLKGHVETRGQVQRAVALAKKVDGVKAVKSFLHVGPKEKTAGYRSQSGGTNGK